MATCRCSEPHAEDASWHGRPSGYVGHGCRCDRCKAWNRMRMNVYNAAHRESVRETALRSRRRNIGSVREADRRYHWANRERILEAKREKYHSVEYHDYETSEGRRRRLERVAIARQWAEVWGRWTPEEDAYLIANRPSLTCLQLALALSRTYNSITARLSTLRREGLLA